MDRIDGPTATARMEKNPLTLSKLAKMLAELLASVHSIDLTGIEIDEDFLTQKYRFERFIRYSDFWTDKQKNSVIEDMNNLTDGSSLCHGDLHLGNIIMSMNGPVIIDWPAASRGNPWLDVAMSSACILSDPYPESAPNWVRVVHRFFANRINKVFLATYLDLRPDTHNLMNKSLVYGYMARIGDMFQEHNTEIPEKQIQMLSFLEKNSYLSDKRN
jgi:aminoglycoside phosphotransferase (APT) family kinase protein